MCESRRGLSAAKFPVLVKFPMCDACLALGAPWLPALHGGRKRPVARRVELGLRVKKPAAKKRPKS
jgi:hypothetical protein